MISSEAISLIPCSEQDFPLVKKFIQAYELDSRALLRSEFLVLKKQNELLGFGRIRNYEGFSELCSLGVVAKNRHLGYGKLISKQLIQSNTQPLYLVCIIPAYFESLGFKICSDYPKEIQDKLNYCTNSLCVAEPYVVMKYSN